MKLYNILRILFLFLSIKGFSQLPLGGTSISGFVCSQGQVFTWGLNKQLSVTGTLGTGSTSQNVSIPTLVNFPAGVTIKSLGGVSGAHFLALDCSGKVWSWGYNGAGQLGIGNTVTQTSTQRVLVQAGSPVDMAGFRDPVTGQLQRIVKTFAGNETSMAITENGQLLSWGCGGIGCDPSGEGLLGNGTTNVDVSYPNFVKDGNNNILNHVIDVSLGDDLAIALVDESQAGLGLGTVYSWGTGRNGSLGRNAAGTANNTNEFSSDNVAKRVKMATATGVPSGDGYLRNITSIAAGDVAGYALDIDGYVWAWGNGGYGGVTGQGITVTHSDPRKVLKGVTTGDGTFLMAKSIASGRAFAMAVTTDGMLVTWGNNGCTGNTPGPAANPNFACGGNLGNSGIGNNETLPVYVQNSSGTIHKDVIAVSPGDFWGYYKRADNSIWTWGDNVVGQLGIGSYTTQNIAVVFPSIGGCLQGVANCVLTGLEKEEVLSPDFHLYPNPSSDFFTLVCEQPNQIKILDMNGSVIESKTVNGSERIGEKLPSGMYVLLISGSTNRTIKLNKVR